MESSNVKKTVALILSASLLLTACEPEVGSKAWCEKMEEKPAGDWTLNETRDYAKHCLFEPEE